MGRSMRKACDAPYNDEVHSVASECPQQRLRPQRATQTIRAAAPIPANNIRKRQSPLDSGFGTQLQISLIKSEIDTGVPLLRAE